MKITILGCGNAFSEKNFNQCFMLEDTDALGKTRRMLIDYGWQAPNALRAAGVPLQSIDDIYISHLHADHIGGLEQMAFSRYDWAGKPRRWDEHVLKNAISGRLYAPRLIANDQLIKDLWSKSLRGGLESMEGFVATLGTFFEPKPIKPNRVFGWQDWTCELIQQIHIMSGSAICWTFGLLMSKEGHKTVYFTTDSQHCSPRQVEVFYHRADIVFQDCECTPFMSGVHANYSQLAGDKKANSVVLPIEIRNKMNLSHYQDFVTAGTDMSGKKEIDWGKKAHDDGFAGFVKLGQVFEV